MVLAIDFIYKIKICFEKMNSDQEKKNLYLCIIATFYLVLMNQQYFLLEGNGVSLLKVTAMCLSPLLLLLFSPKIFIKPFIWGGVYLLWFFGSMYIQYESPRLGTMGYTAMFICMYIVFYNLVYSGAFTKKYFQNLMQVMLWVFISVIVIQQIVAVGSGRIFEIANLYYWPGDNAMKVPGLSLEPSHSARIMGAMFLGFLHTTEFIENKPVTPVYLWKNYRWLTLGFLYAMISMYSGTAMVVLAILAVYFFWGKQLFYVVPLCLLAWILIPQVEYVPTERAIATAGAMLTLDVDEVIVADGSAAHRVAPVLNVLNLDYSDSRTWFGYGMDYSRQYKLNDNEKSIWTDRGVICYIIGILLVFTCAIKPLFSVATLLFLAVAGSSLLNFYYTWGILMIFTVVSYFYIEKQKSRNVYED